MAINKVVILTPGDARSGEFSQTFNSPGTWTAPTRISGVRITGQGGSGNAGNAGSGGAGGSAGNAGNAGTFGTGGDAGFGNPGNAGGGNPGLSPSYVALNEDWNGISWSETADLSQGRSGAGGAGSDSTSAIIFGGFTPSTVATSEIWSSTSNTVKVLTD